MQSGLVFGPPGVLSVSGSSDVPCSATECTRRPKKKRNIQKDARINARIERYVAGLCSEQQFLRAISDTASAYMRQRSTSCWMPLILPFVSYLVWPHRRANHPVGRGLSGLVYEKAYLCLSYFVKSPLEGIDTSASTVS